MSQSRKLSALETLVDALTGQIVSVLIWVGFIAAHIAPEYATVGYGIAINAVFLAASIFRRFLIRRLFNQIEERKSHGH